MPHFPLHIVKGEPMGRDDRLRRRKRSEGKKGGHSIALDGQVKTRGKRQREAGRRPTFRKIFVLGVQVACGRRCICVYTYGIIASNPLGSLLVLFWRSHTVE